MAFGLFECAASFHRTDCFLLRLSLTHLINECYYEQDKIKPCDVTFTLVQTCFLLRKTLNQFVHSPALSDKEQNRPLQLSFALVTLYM